VSEAPVPLLPNYSGANVRGIVPALLAPSSVALPEWMPAAVRGARQVVLMVIDGLGWEQLRERAHVAPTLAAMTGGPITTVAPSTTASALASIATGLTPGEHGLVGYRMEVAGEVLNVLRWNTSRGDARRSIEPSATQPFAPFLGERIPVVSKAELEGSAFTEAHLRGGRPMGYRSTSSLPVILGNLLRGGERFVYAYYDGIDKVAHERGFGEFYDAELRTVDRLVGDVLDQLPSGAVLLVTADHGQVQVGENKVTPHADGCAAVARAVRAASAGCIAARVRLMICWPRRRAPRRWAWVRPRAADRAWLVRPGGQPARGGAVRRRGPGAVRTDQLPRSRRQRAVPARVSTRIPHVC
jgi:hypothetical protein